ncbi:mitochondrial carrier domain-containing protein [Papiliotrema laurentii]|uniref:Mitochondrial carrier domain-containing protein n=1 Tax=Papiliotrema laurentii TaxID=5418 RepID=A0AAD9FJJ8_PAPLA|nr:mitochondrial carrier domain-containing protein [Papiliotrema laurentii]
MHTDSTPSSSSTVPIPSPSPSSPLPPSTASPDAPRKLQGWKHSAAGSLGGMTGAIVTSPFDVVKTRLQSDLFKNTPAHPTSSSTVAAAAKLADKSRGGLWHFVDTVYLIRRIAVEEGWRALYKGLGPSLVGIIPARAINFYCYPTSKAYLAARFPNAPTEKPGQTAEDSPIIHLGAAVIAGVATATGTNPIWVIKTRLQLSAQKRTGPTTPAPSASPLPKPIAASAAALSQAAAASATAAAAPSAVPKSAFGPAVAMTWDILRKDGIRGLYRGLSASYLGVSEGVIQWVLYERFKRLSKPSADDKQSILAYMGSIVGASGGAKAVASLITYPHEVIRTRLRQPAVNGVVKYTGLAQTLKLVLKEEGVASLYGGLTPHMLRVVPNAACMFLIYELVAAQLSKS